jgi:hypothetical protein
MGMPGGWTGLGLEGWTGTGLTASLSPPPPPPEEARGLGGGWWWVDDGDWGEGRVLVTVGKATARHTP